MAIRYIAIPTSAVTLRDPITQQPLKTPDGLDETVSFDQLLGRLMHNPSWGESYYAIKAQFDILAAWDKAKSERDIGRVMLLSEEDWQRLKAAAEFPKPAGFSYHPGLVSQLIPLLQPIFDAGTAPLVKTAAAQ